MNLELGKKDFSNPTHHLPVDFLLRICTNPNYSPGSK